MALSNLLGGGSGNLAKLMIYYELYSEEDWKGQITALFNPSELTINRQVSWEVIGGEGVGTETRLEQQFKSVQPRSTSVELLFDSYETHSQVGVKGLLPTIGASPAATDVRRYTDQLVRLADVNSILHRPPRCRLIWGAFDDIFAGVITSVAVRYTMFMPSGMPVRANVTCQFTEHEITGGTELNSPDVDKRYTVTEGDTLHAIAHRLYGDASRWRTIAQANNIRRPRSLAPGTVISVPKLERGR